MRGLRSTRRKNVAGVCSCLLRKSRQLQAVASLAAWRSKQIELYLSCVRIESHKVHALVYANEARLTRNQAGEKSSLRSVGNNWGLVMIYSVGIQEMLEHRGLVGQDGL